MKESMRDNIVHTRINTELKRDNLEFRRTAHQNLKPTAKEKLEWKRAWRGDRLLNPYHLKSEQMRKINLANR